MNSLIALAISIAIAIVIVTIFMIITKYIIFIAVILTKSDSKAHINVRPDLITLFLCIIIICYGIFRFL